MRYFFRHLLGPLVLILLISCALSSAESSTANHAEVKKLISKMTLPDGSLVRVGVVRAINFSSLGSLDLLDNATITGLRLYGEFPIKIVSRPLTKISLEQFRLFIIKERVDVLVITILKPGELDMYLYDRRTPYKIYNNTEVLPPESTVKLEDAQVVEYLKTSERHLLYNYLQNLYFEIPRESEGLQKAEVPLWVANREILSMVNRELSGSFYAAASVGAALNKEQDNKFLNSNLLGLQFGIRVSGPWYLETALDMFSYNTVSFAVKYFFNSPSENFRLSLGLGPALGVYQYTLADNPYVSRGDSVKYAMATGAIIFPIVDIHFKLETKLFFSPVGGGMVYTLMPGIFTMF